MDEGLESSTMEVEESVKHGGGVMYQEVSIQEVSPVKTQDITFIHLVLIPPYPSCVRKARIIKIPALLSTMEYERSGHFIITFLNQLLAQPTHPLSI